MMYHRLTVTHRITWLMSPSTRRTELETSSMFGFPWEGPESRLSKS